MKYTKHYALFIFILGFMNYSLAAQNNLKPIAHIIEKNLLHKTTFKPYTPLITVQNGTFNQRNDLKHIVSEATIVAADQKVLNEITSTKPELLKLQIPMPPTDEYQSVLLFKAQVLSHDFRLTVRNINGESQQNYKPGCYYRGIVQGDNNSVVAISFFENGDIMGIVSTAEGNFVIGQLNDQSGQFIVYNDQKMKVSNPFTCEVQDGQTRQNPLPDHGLNQNFLRSSSACGKMVRTYLECDFELYTAKSANVTQTTNYATGMYNNVATLYQNENISTQNSEVYVWAVADPFPFPNGTNTSAILNAFGTLRQDSFNGDLAHLVSGASSGSGYSGLAWLEVLCSTYYAPQQSGRFAYSNIAHTYQAVPTYSWTIGCFTHEMGHNLGSEHTHSCCWPGGAIDNCVAVEPCGATSCSPGPTPVGGGTIMSYCHITATGTNFNNGFGTLPGNLIRNNVNTATCLPGDVSPIASFANAPVSGLNVSFNNTATGTNNTYTWNFGDTASGTGNTATGAVATHIFSAEGSYLITLVVTNDCGTDTETQTVSVSNYTPPVLCNGSQNISTCSGTITDGSAGQYSDDMFCSWLIAPANATAVTLTFSNFDTELGYDFVNIYNGSNASAPLLGAYSGSNLPPTLTANSGQMYITFTSDYIVVGNGFLANYSCVAPTPTGNRLQAKVFLEGPFNSTTNNMNTSLGAAIPLSQAYSSSPWNYNGTETIASINNNMVDWVLVELRQAGDSSFVSRKAALLYSDGTLRHVDGTIGADFGTQTGNYFIVIRHRNHLPIMSSSIVSLPNASAYDFSDAENKTIGGNMAMRSVNGKFLVKGGDFDSNGVLNYADFNTAYEQFVSGNSNYANSDADFNNNININDFNVYSNNIGAIGNFLLRY